MKQANKRKEAKWRKKQSPWSDFGQFREYKEWKNKPCYHEFYKNVNEVVFIKLWYYGFFFFFLDSLNCPNSLHVLCFFLHLTSFHLFACFLSAQNLLFVVIQVLSWTWSKLKVNKWKEVNWRKKQSTRSDFGQFRESKKRKNKPCFHEFYKNVNEVVWKVEYFVHVFIKL